MEMGDNKQICRLCLEIVAPGDAEAIGEKKKEIMKVLLINVDLHVIDNVVACSRCMEEVLSGFQFKSACFRVDNCIATCRDGNVPVDMNKIFQEQMKGTAMANVNLENRQICRLCMSLIEDNAFDCNTDLKDIIANCLPEVDIHTVHEPLVCALCFSRMKKLNQFMKACQEIEQTIENYYLQAGVDQAIPVSVNLNDLLKFKDNTINKLIKEKSSDFDSNLLKEPKKEDTANIECEEIHIKDELDSGGAMGDSVPSGANNNSRKSGVLRRKRQIRQCSTKGSKHFSSDGHMNACQECTYKTDRKAILARHMVKHDDKFEVDMHKCYNCEYETKCKGDMKKHMAKHRDPKVEKKLKCDKCPYETNFKQNLCRHNLKHKDKLEVEMHKCENCEYETRYKGDMQKHIIVRHSESKAERKFKCDQCAYETNYKHHLYRHNLRHKDKLEVEMHKCEDCEFETMYKSSMIKHVLKHYNPKTERKFKCDKCPYESDFMFSLRRHNLMHKDKSEVEMHKCDNCEFETMHKSSMVKHMRRKHGSPQADERKFKCDKCPYETDFMFSLRRHSLIHKDKSEVEMHKCENCGYESRYKCDMKKHMVKHREPTTERICD